MISDTNYAIATATVRIFAGVLFLFQGYDKVVNVGMKEVKSTMKTGLGNKKVPDWFLGLITVFSSYVELICGFLLLAGFFRYFAAYLLCADLLLVSVGFSMVKPMWDTSHVLVRLMLLIFLLIIPAEWDRFSLDYLFALSKL